MEDNSGCLTVYYEEPFRVGVFERVEDGKLYFAKFVFRSEPSDKEIFEFINDNYHKLHLSPEVDVQIKNPKRRPKEARKEICHRGVGTKAQEALKKQHDELKNHKKEESRSKKRIRFPSA